MTYLIATGCGVAGLVVGFFAGVYWLALYSRTIG
jgi:hypothetical protein